MAMSPWAHAIGSHLYERIAVREPSGEAGALEENHEPVPEVIEAREAIVGVAKVYVAGGVRLPL